MEIKKRKALLQHSREEGRFPQRTFVSLAVDQESIARETRDTSPAGKSAATALA
jgi:hypothetical protein